MLLPNKRPDQNCYNLNGIIIVIMIETWALFNVLVTARGSLRGWYIFMQSVDGRQSSPI